MDVTQTLIESSTEPTDRAGDPCPQCGETVGSPPIGAAALSGRTLTRCTRCGTRHTAVAPSEFVYHCENCRLPYLAATASGAGEQKRCEACRTGTPDRAPSDRNVARAAEREVRAALRTEWRFLGTPTLSAYLDRLARQLRQSAAPDVPEIHVEIVDDERWWTLALPSGILVVSLGTLMGLEDEAELAFVLAHELVHAADSDADERLSRLGLHVVTVEDGAAGGVSWSNAALDLIRLGYGLKREREADRTAFRVIAGAGYDLNAVDRYLRRLERMVASGDSRVAELAFAHPLPATRRRELDKVSAVGARPRIDPRTNREVFRRVAGGQVLGSGLEPVEGLRDLAFADPRRGRRGSTGARGLRLAILVGAIATAAGLAAWYFLLG